MGAWGFGLFQSDYALDVVDDINNLAAQLARTETLELLDPEDIQAVRDRLNSGLLTALRKSYDDDPVSTIYLGALAMMNGAKVAQEYLELLSSILDQAFLYDEGKEQMKLAIEKYPNDGTPWDFENKGLMETMVDAMHTGGNEVINV